MTLATSLAGGEVQRPGRVLVLESRGAGLRTPDGHEVRSPSIESAIAAGAGSVRLGRPEAASLGLPERTALAGIATVGSGRVQAVGRGRRVGAPGARPRAARAVASGAQRGSVGGRRPVVRHPRPPEAARSARWALEAGLAVAEAVRERDARLVRADKLASLGALGIAESLTRCRPRSASSPGAPSRSRRASPPTSEPPARSTAYLILEQAARIGTRHPGDARPRARRKGVLRARAAGRARSRTTRSTSSAHRFEKAGVSLQGDVAPGLPAIACDPKLFTQVLVNLLLNACEACPAGGSVELDVTSADERVVFAVVDDGHGIAPGDAARAVEPFFTTKASGGGTGLGLAIAREIVAHHGGELRLEARRDGKRGTRASVSLPATQEAPT